MKVFISHNKADRVTARMLAIALVEQGVDVWFDEWEIRPGDSITGGIEAGISDADVFVLVWSKSASKSNWVDTELRAILRRRVDDATLKIVPVIIDDTPLPALVADYRGFDLKEGMSLESIAAQLTGCAPDIEIARRLQDRLMELTASYASPGDPLPYLICPNCGSGKLERHEAWDEKRGDRYLVITCKDCKWSNGTEI